MVINRDPGLRFPVFLLILLLPGLACFVLPLVLSTDSVYGFLAYKGTLETGSFNVITDVSHSNINLTEKSFVSWWSPGQWLVPGLLHFVTGIKLGLASIIITILFAAAGMVGYYKIFRHFGFSSHITALSLLTIFFSSNFNYSYMVYQGGEILSFGIFPWFFLYVIKLSRLTFLSLIFLTLFFLACFIAKTTMIIYCSLVLLYKWAEPTLRGLSETRRINLPSARNFLYGLPALISMIIIYFFFLTRGSIPTVVSKLGFSAEDVLVPLSSPVTAIFSFQNAIAALTRSSRITGLNPLFAGTIYIIPTIVACWLGLHLFRNKLIDPAYKRMIALLYAGLCIFFIFAYSMNTNIDYSTRHLKLLAFLCIPAFIMVVIDRFKIKIFYTLFVLAAFVNLVYFVRLRYKLTTGRYVSDQYFTRNNDKIEETDSLDKQSYQKFIALGGQYKGIKSGVLFYVEANPDVRIDIQQPCITEKIYVDTTIFANTRRYLDMRAIPMKFEGYKGRGPVIIACISKMGLAQHPDMLKQRFPDYGKFRILDETPGYWFYISGEVNSGKGP